ncbi:ankyrin repeat-containing protein At2g01680-like isoform X1 [Cornus florida]|uniref:ankyrin repeat-containing protein At2g01680-like isoform X1 n=1 Tax=Cornus florida TaxID=4283 RepID=UPI00289F47AF|nr:ankyrin repeat-containing protein At2g01680-like isoform X1 [Cornus florida]
MGSMSMRFITHQSFLSTVRSGDLESVKTIIENEGDDQASVSALMVLQNDEGKTALHLAAENNFQEIFSYLLKFCDLQSLMIRSKSDMDPFHVAAQKGHLGIVKELLGLWPELCRSCNSSNTSPLYSAAMQDHLDVVNAILDADASSIKIVRKNGKTSLHMTARHGYLQVVKALIERDPGIVPIKDKKGQTALHMAVKGKDTSVVEEILHADCSILNERDKKGNTALHMATRKGRSQIVSLLLSFTSVDVNAINNQFETAMDLADKLQYGEPALEIKEALAEVGAKHARHVGRVDETMELKRTVSDIKHEVHSQLIQNEKTNRRVSGIAKELKKIHREAVQNTVNSVTVVAVLFASIAFLAIFNLPGQYLMDGSSETGKAYIAGTAAFRVFCLLNATSLFISLAVVVVQITLVAWDTKAQKKVVSVINKLMWVACISTLGAFLSIAFAVVGKRSLWMAITITAVGTPILLGTLAYLCYFVFRQHFGMFGNDSQRRIRRASGSKSFSWTYSANISDLEDYQSDYEKIYAL